MSMNKTKTTLLTFSLLLLASFALADTYNFNNCGSEGSTGPSSCGYSGDNSVNIIGEGIQEWTVPQTGEYKITAYGAQGAGGPDWTNQGPGAVIEGKKELEQGETLRILVGQEGVNCHGGNNCAGGGGTFVAKVDASGDQMFDETNVFPLLVAGGGGGLHDEDGNEPPSDVDHHYPGLKRNDGIATCGNDPEGNAPSSEGDGGCDGEGGEDDSDSAGGSGWFTEGGDNSGPDPGDPFLEGGVGGEANSIGGFGAGSGSDSGSSYARNSGAGGYSGGVGYRTSDTTTESNQPHGSGGGGSFIHASVGNPSTSNGKWGTTGSEPHDVYTGSVNNLGEWNDGHGSVEIELLTDPDDPDIQTPLSPSKSQASSTTSPADMEFSVDVDIDDDGGNADDNTLDQCDVTATGQDNGGSVSPSTSITSSGSGGGTGTCEFDIDNDDSSNWEPGETIDVEVSVEDSYGGTDTISREHEFENTAPETVDVSVVEDDVHSEYDNEVWGGENGVGLEVEVVDYESASTNADVSVELDGGSIGSETVLNGDDSVLVGWERGGESDMDGFTRGGGYGVDATVFDETGLGSSDSISFTVLRPPALSDPSPTEGDGANELEIGVDEFVVDVDSDVDGFDVEFHVDDGTEDYQVGSTQTVSGGDGTASVDVSDFEFRNEPEGGEGEWYVKVENDYSVTDFSQRETTYSFAAQTASLQIQTGDGENLNPGGADIGGSDLEFVMDNEENGGLDRAEFLIGGEVFEVVEPVPESETVSADIRQEVSSEDEIFDWSVRLVDNGDVVEEELGLEFSTHVVDASWTDTSSPGVPAEFNIYHANEDGVFDFGSQDYEKLGTTRDTEISLAPSDLGSGSDDCFRVSAENSGGESGDSSPPVSEDGVCVGGEIN